MRDRIRRLIATTRLISFGIVSLAFFAGTVWGLSWLFIHLLDWLIPTRYVRSTEGWAWVSQTLVAIVVVFAVSRLFVKSAGTKRAGRAGWTRKEESRISRYKDEAASGIGLQRDNWQHQDNMPGDNEGLISKEALRQLQQAEQRQARARDSMPPPASPMPPPAKAAPPEGWPKEAKKIKEPRTKKIARVRSPREASYVNLSFLDTTEEPFRVLKRNEGLYTNLVYKLVVSIGFTPDDRFVGYGEQPHLTRPSGVPLILDVALILPTGVEILGNPWATLQWPADGASTDNAEFTITVPVTGEARLKLMIFHEHDLLFCGDLKMQVGAEGDKWATADQPIGWEIQDPSQWSLYRRFETLDRGSDRRLNISVHKGRDNEYDLCFFIRSRRGSTMALPAIYPLTIKLSDDEITDFLAKTRSALRLLVEDPQFTGFTERATDYDGYYPSAPEGASPEQALAYSRAQETVRDIALIGHDLWNKIFGSSDMGRRMAYMLAQELSEEGVIVQVWIAAAARDFILPWVWLYPPELENGINTKNFWGYRFIVEQIRQKAGSVRPASAVSVDSVRVASALHNFPTRSLQRKFFANYKERYDPSFNWLDIAPHECRAYLAKCDSHILYFYCHGHTEKLAPAYYDDLMKALRAVPTDNEVESAQLFEALALKQRQKIKDFSYIQIEDTVLKMTDLNQFKPAKSTRPLVFLNICESAEFYPGATDNLIDAFLDRDAGGVVGTEMPMLTVFGDLMARRFFDSYFSPNPKNQETAPEGQAIGYVLWKLRREFLDHGNPLAFAYTYFGDATTHFKPAVAQKRAKASASSV